MKDLLRTGDLSREDLLHLLDEADRFRRNPQQNFGFLSGQSVLLYFAKPSTRTRISFETAVAQLGGTPISVGLGELQLGRGETIADTARVISRFCSAAVIRTFADADVADFAAHATVPVINALTDLHHPCQSLADLLTLRNHFGRLSGLRVAYIGDGNNVAHSLIEACAIAGVDIAVATPKGYEPDEGVVQRARRVAEQSGAVIAITHDPFIALRDAHAVYTDVWVSMGDSESSRTDRERAFSAFRVDDVLMARARPEAIFMHCLPAHRGVEVAPSVIDGPSSVVFEQAENRLHTACAILLSLIRGSLHGTDKSADRSAVTLQRV